MPLFNPSGITIGSSTITGGTTGSVLFVGASSVTQQDNANFFWDDTNNRLALANTAAVATNQTALTTGDYLVLGVTGASSVSNKTTIIFNNQGWTAAPSGAAGVTSAGDKIVFWNDASLKTAIAMDDAAGFVFYATGGDAAKGWRFFTGTTELARLNKSGMLGVGSNATPTAFLHTGASTTAIASIRIPAGTAPSSPNSGDLWYDGTNLKFRDGATTRTLTWV